MSSYIRRERHGHLPNPSNLTAHALAAGFVRSSPSFFQGRGKRKLVTTPTPSRARVWNEYFCGSLPRLRSSMRRQEFFRLSLRTAINMLTFLCLFCIPDDKLVLFALLILPLSFYLFFCLFFKPRSTFLSSCLGWFPFLFFLSMFYLSPERKRSENEGKNEGPKTILTFPWSLQKLSKRQKERGRKRERFIEKWTGKYPSSRILAF